MSVPPPPSPAATPPLAFLPWPLPGGAAQTPGPGPGPRSSGNRAAAPPTHSPLRQGGTQAASPSPSPHPRPQTGGNPGVGAVLQTRACRRRARSGGSRGATAPRATSASTAPTARVRGVLCSRGGGFPGEDGGACVRVGVALWLYSVWLWSSVRLYGCAWLCSCLVCGCVLLCSGVACVSLQTSTGTHCQGYVWLCGCVQSCSRLLCVPRTHQPLCAACTAVCGCVAVWLYAAACACAATCCASLQTSTSVRCRACAHWATASTPRAASAARANLGTCWRRCAPSVSVRMGGSESLWGG